MSVWHPTRTTFLITLRDVPTHVTNSMEQNPSWEANTSSASQEIPALYETQSFIAAFTARPYPNSDQTSPCPAIPLLEDPF